MENINWSKTVLGVYRYLPRVTYAFDKIVKTRAYNSFYGSSNNPGFNDVMNISNAILDLTERKITLINLKLIVEKALKSINSELAKILVLKFIDGKKSTEIAEKFGFCLRTFFRKINTALVSFKKALNRLGYDDLKLFDMLKNEKWILEVYRAYESENWESDNLIDNVDFEDKIKNKIMFEFKRVSSY